MKRRNDKLNGIFLAKLCKILAKLCVTSSKNKNMLVDMKNVITQRTAKLPEGSKTQSYAEIFYPI